LTATIIILIIGAAAIAFILLHKKKKQASSPKPVAPVSPNDWRPMLGEAVPGPIKRTPKYRIQYSASGFDVVRPKQIDKTVEWLTQQGATHLVDQFVAFANDVANIPEWIDAAYEKNANRYQKCGGKYAAFISTHDPSTILVEVVAVPMWTEANKSWAGGLAFWDNKTIRCVIVVAGGMKDNPATIALEGPATAHLATLIGYLDWEFGNELMLRFGYVPKRIPEDEWGNLGPPDCR
jgi:hypothetical protein